ncbi:hypothetical protein RO03_02035 [Fusobacterium nucleatum subsp. nucleatum]|uniref:Uncharacterized protein n=1 Tax=Fusobacterium nucleatum subsp. nucleatum TaxID=76856 RepID=A0A0M4RT59_FUSNC|nr:hypothetical protein RN95_00670 [Fusobacterium nucleatum subsp. nucleatum]ERT43079.1 hypothetical protein HMPREF1539_01112 [Fusobacterium nucleatum CTI-2]KUL98333.1 hypothetical protein RO03_02035 [Fusobacterium nucleatum subsp. nucleatum]
MNITGKILILIITTMIIKNYNLIEDLKNGVFNILSNYNEIKLLKNFSIIHYKNDKKSLFNKKLEIFREAQKILGISLIILYILIINIFMIFPNIIYTNYINTFYNSSIFFIILYISISFYKLFFKYTVSVYFITLLTFFGISLIIFSVIQNIILTFSLMMTSILLFYIITYLLFSIDFFKKINICLKISVIFMIVINILLYYLISLLKNYYWIFFIISICIMILLSLAPFMIYIIMYNKNNRENLYENFLKKFFGKEITQFFILLIICIGIVTFSLSKTYLYFKNFIPFFTLEEYIKENNSNIFKSIINYLTIKRKLNDILFLVSIVSGTYFLIGEILVYFKIKKYKEKAQEIYEDIIMNERYYYEQMKKCVYYGEEEYRNLFFNNDKIREIIKQNEKYYKDNN